MHVFVGPTLAMPDVMAAAPEATAHPPVAHGDLLRLDLAREDTVVIVDGYFHQVASVRHKEILWLLAKRVRVIGCASMGALRAAELARFGMVGNGVVFEMYRDGRIDGDDEVAVRHADGPDYRELGVPLVNVRHAAAAARHAGVLTDAAAAAVVEAGRSLYYTERTWRAVERALVAGGPQWTAAFDRFRAFLTEHPRHADIKAADAIDTLSRLDELGRRAVGDASWVASAAWRNRLLSDWLAEFGGTPAGHRYASRRAVLLYHQLYREDFPARWTSFALGAIADSLRRTADGAGPADRTADALAVAAANGITADGVTATQRAEWLTGPEESDLTAEAALVRILVRSFRPPGGVLDLVTAEAALTADPAARRAVEESAAVNAEIAMWAPNQTTDYLNQRVLRAHLADVWQVDQDDDRSMTAAARDRGFHSLAAAVEAARQFFLRHWVRSTEPTPPPTEAS